MAQQASAVVDPGPSGPDSPGVAQRRLILHPGPAPLGHSRHIPHSCPASTRLWPARYGAALIRKQTDGARAGTGVLTGRGRRELIIGRLSLWYLSAPGLVDRCRTYVARPAARPPVALGANSSRWFTTLRPSFRGPRRKGAGKRGFRVQELSKSSGGGRPGLSVLTPSLTVSVDVKQY